MTKVVPFAVNSGSVAPPKAKRNAKRSQKAATKAKKRPKLSSRGCPALSSKSHHLYPLRLERTAQRPARRQLRNEILLSSAPLYF